MLFELKNISGGVILTVEVPEEQRENREYLALIKGRDEGIDMSGADLREASLARRNLSGMSLKGANLDAADLEGANLTEANLTGASLVDADLSGAFLEDTNLSDANLLGANLRDAEMGGVSLTGANLPHATLTDANLRDADLTGANLTEADLTQAQIAGVDFTRANLRDADLTAIRDDLWAVLSAVPHEVPALRRALVEGRIDGQLYEGECACLVGTVEQAAGVEHGTLPLLKPNSERPIERFFLNIEPGHTPESSIVVEIVVEWIDDWTARIRDAFGRQP